MYIFEPVCTILILCAWEEIQIKFKLVYLTFFSFFKVFEVVDPKIIPLSKMNSSKKSWKIPNYDNHDEKMEIFYHNHIAYDNWYFPK